jgi:hypothetical protein
MKNDQSQEEGLAWLLNLMGDFPTHELEASNMRPIKAEQLN